MRFLSRLAPAVFSALEFHLLRFRRNWLLGVLVLVATALGWQFYVSSPAYDEPGKIVVIPRGISVTEVGQLLEEDSVIRNSSVLINILRLSNTDGAVRAGAYRFNGDNAFKVAFRLVIGQFGVPPLQITFTEGLTVREMAGKIEKEFSAIKASDFISAAQPYEGYLFPDTYKFLPFADAQSIVEELRSNFNAKVSVLTDDISESGNSLSDIIIMASLIEREARSQEEKRMVSGVLWNRIEKGMPLQVDAVFGYIYSRRTYSPSFSDLAVDSPYNTYKFKGLPPGPIANPGLISIEAAVHPADTKALYYLTGRDGITRYAASYSEHLRNQNLYLR